MLEWFICPDGELIPVQECLECTTTCRMGHVCLTQPTRTEIAREREWNGVASTTQLLNGTMYEFLKLTRPYAVDPDRRIFMLEGTHHHSRLELVARELNLPAEVPLSIDRDIFDLLEKEDDGWVLTDYKLWGSFRVAKALGIVVAGKVPDPSGERYKTSGKWGKAGSPKMVDSFTIRPNLAELMEQELQLNRYKIMAEEKLPIHILRMQLQVSVRDGGTHLAKGRGITRNSYIIPIQELSPSYVLNYFDQKQEALTNALSNNGEGLQPCTEQECWDGARCKDYCEVAIHCPRGFITSKGGRNDNRP